MKKEKLQKVNKLDIAFFLKISQIQNMLPYVINYILEIVRHNAGGPEQVNLIYRNGTPESDQQDQRTLKRAEKK